MLLTILSLKMWITPVVSDNETAGMKLTAQLSKNIYAKVRVFDSGLDISTASRTGDNVTVRAYFDFDF